ncbi:MAG: hypothetical protein RI964_3288 [Pseudomonadota bacterium]
MPRSPRYIPQDSQKLQERRTQLLSTHKTQAAFAQAMAGEMQKTGGSGIDQPRISRLLNGDEAASVLELLVDGKAVPDPALQLAQVGIAGILRRKRKRQPEEAIDRSGD